jgi:hypothetical protein
MAHGVHIDTAGLDKLAAQFKAASRKARRDYRLGLKEAGQVVADAAREKIADESPRTAESLRVGARGTAGITITAGSKDLPIASLLEGDGRPGTFSHPLFGNRAHWYREATHPYIWPAYLEKKPEVEKALLKYIADAIRGEGLEVEDV